MIDEGSQQREHEVSLLLMESVEPLDVTSPNAK
jgi:hypothetical protein